MKNLNYLNCIEIDEFDFIKDSKHLVTRQNLESIRQRVISRYNLYLNNFVSIHKMRKSRFVNPEKSNLLSCYTVKTKALDNFLGRIIDSQTNVFKQVCPYCLILPRTTFDHYIPEESYPIFSVLGKNLIPSCTTCNGKKLTYWRDSGNRAIIHFLNDAIPNTQFIFGTLSFTQNVPTITFKLRKSPGVSASIYSLAKRHFERLDLLERYQKAVASLLGDIAVDIDSIRLEFGNALNTQAITNILLNKSNQLKLLYGNNYWKSISLDILAASPKYINSL